MKGGRQAQWWEFRVRDGDEEHESPSVCHGCPSSRRPQQSLLILSSFSRKLACNLSGKREGNEKKAEQVLERT